MSSTHIQQFVHAGRAQVYSAIIDPDVVVQWMVPDGMSSVVHEFEAHEGGRFRISLTYSAPDAIGKSSEHTDTYHGRFTRLIPDEVVIQEMEFETTNPRMQGIMTATFTLTDATGGTNIDAQHDGVPSGVSAADNELGWRMSLGKLARLLEGDRAAD